MKLFDDYLPLDGTYDMRRDTTGLSKEFANKINQNKENKSESDCPICLEIMVEPTTIPCNHNFCLDCIKTTLQFLR